MAIIHLVPRGIVTKDKALADEIYEYLKGVGVEVERYSEPDWEKVYVRGLSGAEVLQLLKAKYGGRNDLEVYLFMSRVYL